MIMNEVIKSKKLAYNFITVAYIICNNHSTIVVTIIIGNSVS